MTHMNVRIVDRSRTVCVESCDVSVCFPIISRWQTPANPADRVDLVGLVGLVPLVDPGFPATLVQ